MTAATVTKLNRCAYFPLSLRPCQRRASPKSLYLPRAPSAPGLRSPCSARYVHAGFDSSSSGAPFDPHEHNRNNIEAVEALTVDPQRQKDSSQMRNRVLFGLAIGVGGGGVVLTGGWVFTVAVAAAVFAAAREYFELVRSQGIAVGMTPPPRYVSRACSVICALMPLMTVNVVEGKPSLMLSILKDVKMQMDLFLTCLTKFDELLGILRLQDKKVGMGEGSTILDGSCEAGSMRIIVVCKKEKT